MTDKEFNKIVKTDPTAIRLLAEFERVSDEVIADIEHRADEIDAYFDNLLDDLKEMSTKYGK